MVRIMSAPFAARLTHAIVNIHTHEFRNSTAGLLYWSFPVYRLCVQKNSNCWAVKSTMHPLQLPRVLGKNAQFGHVSLLAALRLLVAGLLLSSTATAEDASIERSAIERSIQRAANYLSREVGSWKAEHNCYSCHHHGDGARALFAATQVTTDSMTPTIKEAAECLGGRTNGIITARNGPFSDRKLAQDPVCQRLGRSYSKRNCSRSEAINYCKPSRSLANNYPRSVGLRGRGLAGRTDHLWARPGNGSGSARVAACRSKKTPPGH